MEKAFQRCMDRTHKYLKAMSAKTAAKRSSNFNTCHTIRVALEDKKWVDLEGQKIPVVDSFKYLGGTGQYRY